MIRKLQAVAIDCADPVRLAGFYAELLGGQVEVDAEDPDWVELRGPGGPPVLPLRALSRTWHPPMAGVKFRCGVSVKRSVFAASYVKESWRPGVTAR